MPSPGNTSPQCKHQADLNVKKLADLHVGLTTTPPVLWWMGSLSAWVFGIPPDRRITIDCGHSLTHRLTSFWFASPLSAHHRSTTWRLRYKTYSRLILYIHELKPRSGSLKSSIMHQASLSFSSAPNSICVKTRLLLRTSEPRKWNLSHTSRLLASLKKSRPKSILSARPWHSATWRAFSTKLFGNINRKILFKNEETDCI